MTDWPASVREYERYKGFIDLRPKADAAIRDLKVMVDSLKADLGLALEADAYHKAEVARLKQEDDELRRLIEIACRGGVNAAKLRALYGRWAERKEDG